jgi:hypothetical protein
MSTDLATLTNDGQSMLEAMGMANLVGGGGGGAYVPRISLLQDAIMGTMEVNGKIVKTEVVPAGAFRINADKDTTIYAEDISVRIFTIRQQLTRYDVETGKTYKTVQATDLKGELKDELGGFNLGKPGGYVADYNSLTDKQKAVRTAKVYYGVATIKNAVNENGEPLDGYDEPIPFVMDVTSSFSRKALDEALKAVLRKNVLPTNYALDLNHAATANKAGKEIRHIKVLGGVNVDEDARDTDTFQMFIERIEGINRYVLSKWDEANSNDPQMDEDDINTVHQFVNVEEAD